METLDQFTDRLSKAVGCYWHCNINSNSLDKYPEKPVLGTKTSFGPVLGRKNTFSWVVVRKRRGAFRISTYEYPADSQSKIDSESRKKGAMYVSKQDDDGKATGIYYFVDYDSIGQDFVNAVRSLRQIMQNL